MNDPGNCQLITPRMYRFSKSDRMFGVGYFQIQYKEATGKTRLVIQSHNPGRAIIVSQPSARYISSFTQ